MQKGQPRKAEKVKRDPSETAVAACYEGDEGDSELDEPSDLDVLSPREAAFVHAAASGMSGKAAAIAAGYSESDAYTRAHRLLRRPRVAAALAELEFNAAAAAGVSRRGLLERLIALADDPEAHPSARVRALEVCAKHLGMLTERLDVTSSSTVVYTLSMGRELDADDDLDELESPGQSTRSGYDDGYGRRPGDASLRPVAVAAPFPSPAELEAPPPPAVEIVTGVSYYEQRPADEAKQRAYLDVNGWR